MKKNISLIILGSLLTTLSVVAFHHNSEINEAFATNIEYVDLGPGVYNPNQSEDLGPAYTSPENYRPDVYSIAYRSKDLMLFPDTSFYQDIGFNQPVPASEMVDTDLSKVRIYSNENTYRTLDYYYQGGGSALYNAKADASQNVTFTLNNMKPECKDIYKIVFEEGFVLPYPDSTHSTKYVIKETLTFKNNDYGVEKDNIIYAFEWTKQTYTQYDDGGDEPSTGETEILPIAAFSKTMPPKPNTNIKDYRLQIRGDIQEDEYGTEKMDIDNGSCRLYIFFGDNDYNSDLNGTYNVSVNRDKFDLSDAEDSYLHTLYEKVLLKTVDGEILTLREVSNPLSGKGLPTYNAGGELNCIVFNIGNRWDENEVSYHAKMISSVTILRGAQFPAFRYTNGGVKNEVRYEQVDDITVNLGSFRYVLWSTTSEFAFNAADIRITSLSARKVNVHTEEIDVNSVVLDIGLSEDNYTGLGNKEIITLGENMTRYVYLNGRALFYSFNQEEMKAYANLDGLTDTISISVPLNSVDEVNEIIVRKGCSVPSLVASAISMEIYGGYVSYNVLSSLSYSKQNGQFVEDSKIYWTLWFDGKNPIRVSNGSTFDFSESAPQGDNNERQRFVHWVDETGEELVGYLRIASGKECFGIYVYSYSVEFKNIDKEFSVMVEHNTRLSDVKEVEKVLIPQKEGFAFQGYVDQNGDHFNINNRVTKDLVLTAVWESATKTTTNNVQNTTALTIALIVICSLAVLSLAADLILFIVIKKKK